MPICAGTRSIHDRKIQEEGTGIMAKSNRATTNEKIAETVVATYKKIQDTVVGSYTKIEDAFVDRYLAKDGETVDEAKARLKREQQNAQR